jgi:hypothetical protein
MRPALTLLAILIILSVVYAVEPCIACSTFANASAANILYSVDQLNKTLTVSLFYENLSSSPSRLPINNTIVIVELTNATGLKEIYKVYTNNQGQAIYNFAARSDGCLSMKILYCPFCNPGAPTCGFAECLNYAKIHNETYYYDNVPVAIDSADDIPDGTSPIGAPGTLNPDKYFPDLRVASYCAPPPPLNATPALCLPMLIIFSLLGGALYLTGKNPFMGFNIGGARVGRHIRYQARGRGYSLSVMSVVSAAQSITGAAKALAKGGGKELAKQEAGAAKGRFIGGDIAKVGAGISAMSSAARVAGRKGAKSGDFARHMEARMGSGAGGRTSGPQQQQQSGTSMAMAPTGGGARGSELTVGGNYGAQVFGSLGKMMVFFAMNTTLGRCVDGLISVGQGWTENSRERGIFEMLFISHSGRAQQDLQAMRDVMVADSNGQVRGVRVTLPGGTEGVVRDITTSPSGITTIRLEPPPGSSARGDISVTMGPDGKINAMQFTMSVPMQQIGTDGRVVNGPDGHPNMTMQNVTISVTRGADGNLRFDAIVPRDASPELLRAVGHPELTLAAGVASTPVRIDASFQVGSIGTGESAHPLTADAAYRSASSGGAIYVGANAADLLSQCRDSMGAMREMQQSFQREVSIELQDNRARVESELGDKGRAYLGGVREREATRELALTLGVREEALHEGSPLLSGLTGDAIMGGAHGRAVTGISDAYRSSDLASAGFASSLAGETRGGFEVSDRDRTQIQGALAQVISTSGARELDRMDGDQLRTQTIGALTQQIQRQTPGGMATDQAQLQATQMVAGMNFQAIDRRIDSAVASFDRNLASQGFSGDMRREVLGVDMSQVQHLASYGAPIEEGGRFRDSGAMMQNQGRIEIPGAPTVDTYQISPTLRATLNERSHLDAMYTASTQVAQDLSAGRFSTQDVGQLNFMQQQNLRFVDAVFVSGAQQQGTPQQYGVDGELFGGTSTLAQAGSYGAHLPHADPGEIRQQEQEERRAREDVQTAVLHGDLAQAQAIVQERVHTYGDPANGGSGNEAAARGWLDVGESITTWRANPDAYQAVRNDASGMGLSTLVPEMHPAGADMGAIAQRETQVGLVAQQEGSVRSQIYDAFQRDDYRTAEALCSQQIRYYRDIGDERTALTYDLALIQVSGLRREVSDQIPGSFWAPGTDFTTHPTTDDQRQTNQRIQNDAEQRVLRDLSDITGPGARLGQDAYQRVGQMERQGDASLRHAADRVEGLTYGRSPPPTP